MKHKLGAYKDGYKWITYCVKCSLEEGQLEIEPNCVGRYVSPLNEKTIREINEKIDTLKSIF